MRVPRDVEAALLRLAESTPQRSAPDPVGPALAARSASPAPADGFALELALWCRSAGLPEPVREHRFHATRRWRFDFAWPADPDNGLPPPGVCLEVDGGMWGFGRHQRPEGYEADAEKFNEASVAGWVVIRATYAMLRRGEHLPLLERALSQTGRAAHSSANAPRPASVIT